MRVIKLPWLNHTVENRKFEVYSLSISADGSRMASGGLDGKVRIWSVDTIITASARPAASPKSDINLLPDALEIPPLALRPLCSMARHNGAVTVVRFDPLGRFLASGSDDKILLIWERDEEALVTKGFGQKDGEVDLEHWTVRKRAVAHDNDIQDMAWAPDSSILVTVGLDRSIVVWNGNTFEKIKRFDIHQSLVKGIVFDPAGKYFATASDDRTVRIFRYHKSSPSEMTFSVDHVCVEPFKKSPLTSYFRRCSWSPDGQYIAAPNATNGPVASVAIINRGNWESNISLIGHDTPCEVVSFSPRLFDLKSGGTEPQLSSILATGGQDKALAIWNTARTRPLVVLNEICHQTITDLAWTPDGEKVFVSSLDGTITLVAFDPEELGVPVPVEVNGLQLHRYGADRDSMAVPENTQQLVLEDMAEAAQKLRNGRMDRLLVARAQSALGTPQKAVTPETAVAAISDSFDLPSTPETKKRPTKGGPNAGVDTGPAAASALLKLKQRVVITKEGRKRVTPLLISNTARQISKTTLSTVTSLIVSQRLARALATTLLSRPSYPLPSFGLSTCVAGLKGRAVLITDDEPLDGLAADAIEQTLGTERTVECAPRALHALDAVPSYLLEVAPPPETASASTSPPKVLVVMAQGGGDRAAVLEVRNGSASLALNETLLPEDPHDDEPTEVISNDGEGNRCFQIFFPAPVIQAIGFQNKFWALALANGHLAMVTPAGALLCPPVYLGGAPAALMRCTSTYLLVVTTDARVFVWNVLALKGVFRNVTLAPILNLGVSLTKPVGSAAKRTAMCLESLKAVELTDTGVPVVITNKHEAFAYCGAMKVWSAVVDPWYFRLGDETGKRVTDAANSQGIMAVARARCSREVPVKYTVANSEFVAATRVAFKTLVTLGEAQLGLP